MSTSPKPRGRRYRDIRRRPQSSGGADSALSAGSWSAASTQTRSIAASLGVRGVVAAEPPAQQRASPARPVERRRTSGISITRRRDACCMARRGEDACAADPCSGSTGRRRRARHPAAATRSSTRVLWYPRSTNTSRPDASSASSARFPAASGLDCVGAGAEQVEHLRGRARAPAVANLRAACTFTSSRTTEQRPVHDVGERELDTLAGIAVGRDRAQDPARRRACGSGTRGAAGSRGRAAGAAAAVVANRAWIRAMVSLARAAGATAARSSSVSPPRGTRARSARRSRRTGRPSRASRSNPRTSARERVQRLGRGAHLPRDLPGEVAEHVFLAREVLVEGDARAAGQLRDPVDAAARGTPRSPNTRSAASRMRCCVRCPRAPTRGLSENGPRRTTAAPRSALRGVTRVTLPLDD